MNWRDYGDCLYLDFAALFPANSRIRQDGEARACFEAGQGLTRLLAGFLKAESSYATDFAADPPANKNALNLRPRGGSGFQQFASWADGIREWKARLTDPSYAYAATVTLSDLVHIYAPSSDNNNESAYVATVQGVIDKLTPGGIPMSAFTPLRVVKSIIPMSLPNRPGGKLDLSRGPLHVTIHETANYSQNATARFHAQVWQQSADAIGKQVAVHLYAGEDAIYQCLPLDEIGWHAGDGCNDPATDVGCFRSVAIEKDVSAGTNPALVNKNLAICMSMIAAGDPAFDWGSGATRGKFDTEHYDQHIWVSQETPPHDCPYDIRHDVHPPMDWNWLMAQVDIYYPQVVAYLKGITPAPVPQPTPKPTPDLSKLPVPGIPLPAGLTTAYLKRRFAGSDSGMVTVDGTQYQFDANDPLSRAWLRKCLASIPDGKGYEDGQFPALTGAVKRAGTPNNKQGIDYLFSNGWTVPVYDQASGK